MSWGIHSSAWVAGGQEVAAQAEAQEAEAGDKDSPFPHKDSTAAGLGPR